MSSNEDYLDGLLKSLTSEEMDAAQNQESHDDAEHKREITQDELARMLDTLEDNNLDVGYEPVNESGENDYIDDIEEPENEPEGFVTEAAELDADGEIPGIGEEDFGFAEASIRMDEEDFGFLEAEERLLKGEEENPKEDISDFDVTSEQEPEHDIDFLQELEPEQDIDFLKESEPEQEMELKISESDFGEESDLEQWPEVEETEEVSFDENKIMSAEEIANLLSSLPELETGSNKNNSGMENIDAGSDVTELLDMMPEDDELSEINALLKKNDSSELVEDDMLALLENAGSEEQFQKDSDFFGSDDIQAEQLEEKPSRQKKSEAGSGKTTGKAGTGKKTEEKKGAEEKKPGFFAKLFKKKKNDKVKQETVSEESQAEKDDNLQLLEEMDKKDKKAAKNKKAVKEKKEAKAKPAKKGKKGSQDAEEDGKAADKGKKKKKEKAPKKVKPPKAPEPPLKKLPRKSIVLIFIICGSILVFFVFCLNTMPYNTYIQEAREELKTGNFEKTYKKMAGLPVKTEDEMIYYRSIVLTKLNRRYDNYEMYLGLGKNLNALDALVQGVKIYDEWLPKAQNFEIEDEFNDVYSKIVAALNDSFQIQEEQARQLATLGSMEYTKELKKLVGEEVTVSEGSIQEESNTIDGQEMQAVSDNVISVQSDPEATLSENNAAIVSASETEKPQDEILYEIDVKPGDNGEYGNNPREIIN